MSLGHPSQSQTGSSIGGSSSDAVNSGLSTLTVLTGQRFEQESARLRRISQRAKMECLEKQRLHWITIPDLRKEAFLPPVFNYAVRPGKNLTFLSRVSEFHC